MVQVNFASQEFKIKLVYYGPGMSGKTTNLEYIHQHASAEQKGELVSIATEGDRTLVFDFLPLEMGKIGGMKAKFQLYTVPGQTFYSSTRKFVLQGVDGVVFVADSQKGKMRENLESLLELYKNIKEYGLSFQDIPLVMQWNKRDLPEIIDVEIMEKKLNLLGVPSFEAVAIRGEGVFSTLHALTQLCMEKLQKEYGGKVHIQSLSQDVEKNKEEVSPPKRRKVKTHNTSMKEFANALREIEDEEKTKRPISPTKVFRAIRGEKVEEILHEESASHPVSSPALGEEGSSPPSKEEENFFTPTPHPGTSSSNRVSLDDVIDEVIESRFPTPTVPLTPSEDPSKSTPFPPPILPHSTSETEKEEKQGKTKVVSKKEEKPSTFSDSTQKENTTSQVKQKDKKEHLKLQLKPKTETKQKKIPSTILLRDIAKVAPMLQIQTHFPSSTQTKRTDKGQSSNQYLPSQSQILKWITDGKVLENLEIPYLDLSNQVWEAPFYLENCRIGTLRAQGAIFKKEVRWNKCRIQNINFGKQDLSGDRKITLFEGAFRLNNVEIEEKADFQNCQFLGPIGWSYVNTPEKTVITFFGADFKRGMGVRSSKLGNLDLREATFFHTLYWDNLELFGPCNGWKTNFGGKVSMDSSTFHNKFLVLNSQFEKEVSVLNCTFSQIGYWGESQFLEKAEFLENRFLSEALFQGSHFHKNCIFASIFKGEVYFRKGCFQGLLDFSTSIFESKLSLEGIQLEGKIRFSPIQVLSLKTHWKDLESHLLVKDTQDYALQMEEYSFLKEAFQKEKKYIDMDKAYLAYRRARRKVISQEGILGKVQAGMEILLLDFTSGYGILPFRLALSALVIIISFSLLFFFCFSHAIHHIFQKDTSFGFLESLYLSMALFFGSNREWLFEASSLANLFGSLEAMFGLAIIFLFVYLTIRKLLR